MAINPVKHSEIFRESNTNVWIYGKACVLRKITAVDIKYQLIIGCLCYAGYGHEESLNKGTYVVFASNHADFPLGQWKKIDNLEYFKISYIYIFCCSLA